MKGKKATLKNPPGKMFCDYLVGRPYLRDTREIDSLAWLFNFQSYASHVATLWVGFSRNPLNLQLSLSLHQLNTKPNTIKSHKIQGTKLKQLQHFLLWNKTNIKHSCKSQLYRIVKLLIHSFTIHLLIMNNNIIICNHHDMVSMIWSFWTLSFKV